MRCALLALAIAFNLVMPVVSQTITANVQVVDSVPGKFVPLQLGGSVQGFTNRLTWSSFPALIDDQPLHIWQVAGTGGGSDPSPPYGIVSFNVETDGPVWLATTTRFGGGGNSSGGWIPELTSREELEADGWTEIATEMTAYDQPTDQTGLEFIVFQRDSLAGEMFTYRTEKYTPPLLLTTQFNEPPDPSLLFFDDFESEPEPTDPRGFTENYADFENWDVVGTGVDLFARRFFPEQGIVVDLDHTSGSTLITKEEFDLPAGIYELSFDLGGPFGGTPENGIVASLGDSYSESITIDRGAAFQSLVREITVNEPTTGKLWFTDLGADSNGALLDNVQLTFLSEIIGPLPGDINGDGVLTVEDLDQLTEAIRQHLTDPVFDVNDDGTVNGSDRLAWVTDIKRTVFGDANLDGEFNSTDLLQLFQIGEYEDGVPGNSTWGDGDFGGDFEFDSDDLVLALQTGAYEQGPVVALPIPEPDSLILILAGLAAVMSHRRFRAE